MIEIKITEADYRARDILVTLETKYGHPSAKAARRFNDGLDEGEELDLMVELMGIISKRGYIIDPTNHELMVYAKEEMELLEEEAEAGTPIDFVEYTIARKAYYEAEIKWCNQVIELLKSAVRK